jgi:hypothetical protein
MKTRSMEVCTELTSHPMVRGLRDLVTPLIVDESHTKTLTAADSYNLDVFDATGAVIQSFDLLERSRNFARSIPSANYLRGLKINRHDWLEYHISTFLITLVTIGDETVLLVNDVLRLGIDSRHCRAVAVKSNKWVKDTSLPTHLDAIENLIRPHRKTRNRLVHGGKVPSLGSFVKSGNLDQLKGFSLALQYRPGSFPEAMHVKLQNAYVKALIQIDAALDREICELRTAVWRLLTALHKFYSMGLSTLSSSAVAETPAN